MIEEGVNNLYERLVTLLGTSVLGLLISLVAWRNGFYRLNADAVPIKDKIQWWQVLGAFVTFLSVQFIVMPFLYIIWISIEQGALVDVGALKFDTIGQSRLNLLGVILTTVALGLFCFLQDRETLTSIWGWNANKSRSRDISNFLMGSATWLVAYPLIGAIDQLTAILVSFFYQGPHVDQIAVNQLKNIVVNPVLFWSMVIVIISIVPLLEEMLFRGFLQTWLKEFLGVKRSIVLTSAVFALLHFSGSQGFDNLELIISLFTLSCFLGFIRERQNSLWASIGLHSTFNIISIIILLNELRA